MKDGSQTILNFQCGQSLVSSLLEFWSKTFLSLDHFNFGSVQSALVGPSAPISNAVTGAVLNFMSNSNGACESPTFCAVQKAAIYALNVVLNYQMLEE